jgi:hypothetical protein
MTKTKNHSDVTFAKKPAGIKRFLMKKAILISWRHTTRSQIRGIYFRGNPSVIYQARFH